MTPEGPQPVSEVRATNRRAAGLSSWLWDVIVSLGISAFIIVFLYQPVKVEGTSMMPSLDDQEHIFINKFVYSIEPIQRGDIVVFRYPRDPAKSFIKRVIGVAGDHVRIVDGHVILNGKMLIDLRGRAFIRGSSCSARLVFRAWRSSQFVERQPRLWSGGGLVHLRQSGVRLLAHGQGWKAEVISFQSQGVVRSLPILPLCRARL
jgi:signal peptidase I